MRWFEIDKGDPRGRVLADRHYTRIRVGHPMWTRPGWNFSLYAEQQNGRAAVFNWWRPKWESGLLGTARKDKLKAIECTIFRNETRFRSSDLIREAVSAVLTWKHALDVEWSDGLISGVSSVKTAGGRAGGRELARQVLSGSRLVVFSTLRQEQACRQVACLYGPVASRREACVSRKSSYA